MTFTYIVVRVFLFTHSPTITMISNIEQRFIITIRGSRGNDFAYVLDDMRYIAYFDILKFTFSLRVSYSTRTRSYSKSTHELHI